MTLSVRNSFLALAFTVLILIALAYSVLAGVLVTREGWNARVGTISLLWLIGESAVALAVALVGFLFVRRAYRKSAAPELFFFALFLVTLGGEALLLWQGWLNFEGYPSWFSGLLTRIIWALRFAGLLFLFCGSLFSFDFPYRKYGTLVAASVAAGMGFAALIPLHTVSARNHVLFAIGDASGVVLVTTILAVVTAADYLLGARRPGAVARADTRSVGALFLLGGWILSIVVAPWCSVLAVPGIFLATWKAEQTTLTR